VAAWAVVLPLAGGVAIFLLGRRASPLLGPLTALAVSLAVSLLAHAVWQDGARRVPTGGWRAPLGIELYADSLSVFMLLLTAVVGLAVSLYALGYFAYSPAPWRRSDGFWPLWLFLWAAMNGLYLSADLFNLYVALELLTLAAVALVVLSGAKVSMTAGMRYLLAALAASLLYLFGVALLYGAYGTLDLAGLGARIEAGMLSWVALSLMVLGLAIKAALFPFHFWLPPAHASAPAPVSALLSGLVVKAGFYLVLRLWLEGLLTMPLIEQALGVMGIAAIVWGSLMAMAQTRLKLLIAYSTVAQMGYLFLLFPLQAPSGGLIQALAHALAKAAMFLVAGVVIRAADSDSFEAIGGVARHLPLATLAFALAGFTLLGLPPSSGYLAKELLLEAASGAWEVILRVGSLLTAVYLALALRPMLHVSTTREFKRVPRIMELAPLFLALLSVLLGLLPLEELVRLE
jgi:multicomponent Na+:H+ antiporter subunit D